MDNMRASIIERTGGSYAIQSDGAAVDLAMNLTLPVERSCHIRGLDRRRVSEKSFQKIATLGGQTKRRVTLPPEADRTSMPSTNISYMPAVLLKDADEKEPLHEKTTDDSSSGDEEKDEIKAGLVDIDDAFTRDYRRKMWFVLLIRATCVISVASVCMNSPVTFEKHPGLRWVTLGTDIFCLVVLTCECAIKIRSKGFVKPGRAYLRSPGRVFEFVMLCCLWASVVLQILEISIDLGKESRTKPEYVKISWVRSLRPLLLLRVIKSVLNLSLPKNVSSRSLKQIWSVILFCLYLMSLAAVIGVQIFGLMKYYCIRSTADPSNVTYSDMLIPPERCDPNNTDPGIAYVCPDGFVCREVKFNRFRQDQRRFENILTGLLTIYETTSMEGWAATMYVGIDTRHFLFAVVYFVCCIFFLAWLLRNVFTAIVTEAFADLRVQVRRRLLKKTSKKEGRPSEVLKRVASNGSDSKVQLVKVKDVLKQNVCHRFIKFVVYSRLFKAFIYVCIVADAIFQGFVMDHDYRRYGEIAFTALFDVEAVLKVVGMGASAYWDSKMCRFEVVLCAGSTICLNWVVKNQGVYAVFQVLRPFRLILVWGGLLSFFTRMLGSGKKLGSLIVFTGSLLVIASGISLQLFCGLGRQNSDYNLFHTFPGALKSIFQVLMSDAWNDIMDRVLYEGGLAYSFLVFTFFVSFHVIAALVLISVFIALVLDNLELSEEAKVIKQRKLGEEAMDTHEKLPARLRIFDKLKANPKVIKVENVDSPIPKVRDSFVNRYLNQVDGSEEVVPPIVSGSAVSFNVVKKHSSRVASLNFKLVQTAPQEKVSTSWNHRKQSSVSYLVEAAQLKRSVYRASEVGHHRTASTVRYARRGALPSASSRVVPSLSDASASSTVRAPIDSRSGSTGGKVRDLRDDKSKPPLTGEQGPRLKEIDIGQVRQKREEAQRKKEALIEHLRENYPGFDQSLFAFSENNPIRRVVHRIVHARYKASSKDIDKSRQYGAFSVDRVKRYIASQTYLDWVMILFTQISCLSMLFETPSVRTFDRTWTSVIEYVFVLSTSIELALKVLADGMLFSPNAFIKDFSGILHVFIYLVSLTYVCWQPTRITAGSAAQILLVLRSLRPLRIITLAPPLTKVVKVLVRGYKDILKVALFQVVVMFVFASYGVQALGGKLKKCNDATITTMANCTGMFKVSLASPKDVASLAGDKPGIFVPRQWRNPRNFNFDNMGAAFQALFEVLSLEGWEDVRDVIEQQVGWVESLYPHVYVFFACLIGLTLFIGVIVSNFNENKGIALLTVEQKRWKDLKKRLELAQPLHLPARPNPHNARLRCWLYDLFQSAAYGKCYIVVVLINCATLMVGQWEPTELSDTLLLSLIVISVVCCATFAVDAVVKIYCFSFRGYWLSWRNRFDFLLTILGVVFSVWSLLVCYSPVNTSTCDNSKLFGVAIFVLRFLSLSGKTDALRMLMLTVVMSLTKSFYTVSCLLMIMACYAFAGVILFGSVKLGVSLNRHANFRTSWNALLLLFRITTGEDWNKLMHDASLQRPYCRPAPSQDYWESNCGNKTAALVFFYSYYVLITYIFLNLFIAVVIENFSIFYSTDDDPIMSQAHIRSYQDAWNMIDVEKTGFISVQRAKFVLCLLPMNHSSFKLKRMACEVEKLRNGKPISFHDLLFVLAYKEIDISKSLQLEERLAREEHDDIILEEVATDVIKQWAVRVWRKRKEARKKASLERKPSGISVLSWPSVDSTGSDAGDDTAAVSSLFSTANLLARHPSASPQTSLSADPAVAAQADAAAGGGAGLRRRGRASTAPQENAAKREFYDWWCEVSDVTASDKRD